MMVNLLVVEDDINEINDWKKIIKRHNQIANTSGEIEFYLDIAKDKDEALIKINTFNFSVAIIDIRLKEEGKEEFYKNTDGLDVLSEI
ncbi:hypothetical protein, partial [Vibrio cholerae]